MCVDEVNGAIVVAVGKVIKFVLSLKWFVSVSQLYATVVIIVIICCCRVYDVEQFRLVQTNVGHTDLIRSIIHVPDRQQASTQLCDLN